MELLIGCGRNREKKLAFGSKRMWSGLVTLDVNPDCNPDVKWDLTGPGPLPFEENSCDEIHAYNVLEYTGVQGDWRFFFAQWMDFYRILKPGGVFFGISPAQTSAWAWGDPGHTRMISPECLTFLHQPEYDKEGSMASMTDYRLVFQGDFDRLHDTDNGLTYQFALQAVKPSRLAAI